MSKRKPKPFQYNIETPYQVDKRGDPDDLGFRDRIQIYVGSAGDVCMKQRGLDGSDNIIIVHRDDVCRLTSLLTAAYLDCENVEPRNNSVER